MAIPDEDISDEGSGDLSSAVTQFDIIKFANKLTASVGVLTNVSSAII